jgi:ABC-type glycerol-3-phosphate transport system substrate-binding protein
MTDVQLTRRTMLAGAMASTTFSPSVVRAAPTTITYWTILDPKTPGPRSQAQTDIIDSFMRANPDIKVEVVAMNYAKINPTLIQSAAAGSGPDVVKVFQPWLTQPVEAGTLQPLNDLLAAWPESERQDFVFPLTSTTFKGETFSLLHELRTDLFWYRKDLLDKAGLAVPTSWDQVAEAAGKIASGRLVGYGVGASSQQGAAAIAEWFHPMIWGAGGELFDDSGNAVVNSEAGVRALQWLRDLVRVHKGAPSSIASITTEGQLEGVKSGTIAMTTDQSTRLSTARAGEGIGANLLTGPVPNFPGKPSATGSSGWTLGIGKHAKNRDAAWAFIRHYLSAPAQVIDAKLSASLPSRKSAYQDTFFSSGTGSEMKGWADYMAASGRMPHMPENYPRLLELEALAIQKVLLSDASPKAALDDAVKAYNGSARRG